MNTAIINGPIPSTNCQYRSVIVKENLPLSSQLIYPNIKYIVKHNFDLNQEEIQLPENCIIAVDGGLLSNGTLIGNESILIDVNRTGEILDNVTQLGTWKEADSLTSISIGTVTSGSEPEVTITGNKSNPILNFVFPKGDKGDKGDTGNGIQQIQLNSDYTLTVTYTNGTTYTTSSIRGEQGIQGEQGVSVSSFQQTEERVTDTLYNIVFSDGNTQSISIPKGATGPTGETGPTGNGIQNVTLNGDYTLTINYTNGTSYTTSSIRGAQGDSGYSGNIEDLQIVNNLTEGGSTAALSAEMGKELSQSINIKYDNSQSGLVSDNIQRALDSAAEMLYADQETDVPIGNDGTHYNVAISGGSWVAKTSSRDQKCNLIKVNEGEVYKITAKTTGSYDSVYAWLTTSNHTAGESADFLTGYEQVIIVDVGSYTKTIVPEGAEYMYIGWVVNGNDRLPSNVSRTITIKKDTKNINAKIDALSDTTGVSPLYSNNQSFEITNGTLYPRSAAICTGTSWTTSGESRSIFIPVGNAKTMSVTANDDADAAVGFVTKVYASGDTSPQWASGWSEVLRITAGETQELSVPTDSKYLYVGLKSSTGVVLMPESVDVVDVNTIDESLNQLADNDTVINGDISAINEELYKQGPATIYAESEELDLSAYTLKEGLIATENVWKISGMQAHIMIPIGNALSFSIVSNSSSATSYAWLTEDEDAAPNAQPKYAEGETGKRTIDMGETDYTLPTPPPSDAAYLYITAMGTSGNNVLPSKIIVASIDPNYVPPRNVSRITLLEEGLEENTNKTNAILGNYEATDGDMNLNILKAGREDGAICYWWYPHIISTLMPHKRIYYTSVDTYGGTSVACVNGFDKRAWKTVLKRMLNDGEIDLHSTACIQMLSDGRLICAYTEGHSQTNYMHIRVTKRPEDITEWDYKAKIDWGGNATYSQYHYINGRHYIFSRVGYGNYNTNSWAFVYSDDLETWSEPHTFIVQSSNYQYYIWLKPIADEPNMLRFISYSNPAYNDTNIRCGVIDFEHDKVYKHDGVTELTGSINSTAGLEGTYSSSQFDVLVTPPNTGKQRLFDLAVTNLDTIRIAYGRQSSIYVGNYHVYEWVDGVATDFNVVGAGDVLFNHNNTLSQCGICFVDKDTLFVSRSSTDATGYDYMEIWKRGESGWTLYKEVYKELKGTGHYRNAYPIADPNGRYVMWMRGFLSQNTYAGSNTDVIIYDVEKDEIF